MTLLLQILELALRSAVEFLDLEISLPEQVLNSISNRKGHTKIIASYHDPRGTLSWSDDSWMNQYKKALQYGDVTKLVGMARSQEDNFSLLQFQKEVQHRSKTPLIAINMGEEGQLSRIQNAFLTPVSHPALPFKAAPGQLSAAEIRTALSLHGVIKRRKFFLFGKPIAQSRSPALHNSLFKTTGLPHTYGLLETENAADLRETLSSEDFGGGSVTIPLKLDIIDYLDAITEDAKVIGAVNTIVVDETQASARHPGHYLTGRNTDWLGMKLLLEKAGTRSGEGQSGLIIGGGGTARAAIFTLHAMGFSPIYVLGRSIAKLQDLASSFPDIYDIRIIASAEDCSSIQPLSTVIGTIPADKPIDSGMQEVLNIIFSPNESRMEELDQKVFLEMAYKPAVTSLMKLSQLAGWKTIPGLEVLAGQGFYAFETWTGITPLFSEAREAVMGT